MYSIAVAAALTGLEPETIRSWERSAGLPPPERSPAGVAGYGPSELARLAAVAALVDVGWDPAAAVLDVLDRARRGDRPAAAPRHAPLDELAAAFLAAARSLDVPALSDIIDTAWDAYGGDVLADSWLLPMLAELDRSTLPDPGRDPRADAAPDRVPGKAARPGSADDAVLAGVRLATDVVHARLMTDYAEGVRHVPADAPPVVVGVAPGVCHDLGALAFTGLLVRGGARVTFLGGDLPESAWAAAARATGARHIVVAVTRAEDTVPTTRLLERLWRGDGRVTVHVGGAHQHLVRPPAIRLGHQLAPAADAVALALAFERLEAAG